MSKHWKSIVAAVFAVVALAVVVAAATGREGAGDGPESNAGHAAAAASAADVPRALWGGTSGARLAATGEGNAAAPAAGLQRIDPQTVCMVNDRAMGKPQIPVEVDEKTYYGCCEMCKTRLAQEEAVRYGTDPVTGERVDKAHAVIAERPDGSVVYFANEESFARFGEEQAEPR